MTNLERALAEWRIALGEDAVRNSDADLAQHNAATYSTPARLVAVLSPESTEQVSEIMRIASRHGVAVYPWSRGRNWGYGSRTPIVDGSVGIDLGRMRRILDIDDEMGTATVEAGVSFWDLVQALHERGSRWFVSVPGTSADASVVGNLLERGWGFGPYSDRFAHSTGMEVVLADGTVVQTGLRRWSDARAGTLHRWGSGPAMDGLFTQSNFGIVTSLTVFLAPVPNFHSTFLYRVDGEDRLPSLIDALRWLRMQGIVRTNVTIGNVYRQIMIRERVPRQSVHEPAELSDDRLVELKHKHGLGDFNGIGALYCVSAEQLEAEERIVHHALEPHVDAMVFLDPRTQRGRLTQRDSVLAKTGYDIDALMDHYYEHTRMLGDVTGRGLHGAFWRKPEGDYDFADLDGHGVGFIWVDPVVPFRGSDVRDAVRLASRIQREYGFEPNFAFNAVTERSMMMTCALVYDATAGDLDARAHACSRALGDAMVAAGFPLGRLTTRTMDYAGTGDSGAIELHRRIANALNPAGILAPGRYDPRSTSPA